MVCLKLETLNINKNYCFSHGFCSFFIKPRFSHMIANGTENGSKNQRFLKSKIEKKQKKSFQTSMLFSISFFFDFGWILGGFWGGLGGFGGSKIESPTVAKAHLRQNWMFDGFGEGLGRLWDGFWEGFGRVLGRVWVDLGGFQQLMGRFWSCLTRFGPAGADFLIGPPR